MINQHYAFPGLNNTVLAQGLSWWTAAPFTHDGLRKIIELCEALPKVAPQVGGYEGEAPSRIRACELAWVPMAENTQWVYDRLAEVIRALNKEYYGFHLMGFEQLQYTTYCAEEGKPQGHYDWHEDKMGQRDGPQRKLSLVMQLSEPEDYEGGDLMVWLGAKPEAMRKGFGCTVAFPSWAKHRVTPVTQGIRRSLVCWAVGPQFT